jgi:hypothetical protein
MTARCNAAGGDAGVQVTTDFDAVGRTDAHGRDGRRAAREVNCISLVEITLLPVFAVLLWAKIDGGADVIRELSSSWTEGRPVRADQHPDFSAWERYALANASAATERGRQ